MIKENYKPDEKVGIIKNGIFNELEGVVVSVNHKERLPLKVNLGEYGTWNFGFEDVISLKKEKAEQAVKAVKKTTTKKTK